MKICASGVFIAALMCMPSLSFAQTETVDYIGSNFTNVGVFGNAASAAQDVIPQNTGQIVLSMPLGDNLTNVAVNPASYSFDSNTRFGIYLSSQNPYRNIYGNYASFVFSTNGSGAVTGWNINVTGGIFGGTNSPSSASVSITTAGDSFASGFSTPSCASPQGGSCYHVMESNSAPGTFSSGARAPEIDPRSMASALTLLIGAVAVLRGRRMVVT